MLPNDVDSTGRPSDELWAVTVVRLELLYQMRPSCLLWLYCILRIYVLQRCGDWDGTSHCVRLSEDFGIRETLAGYSWHSPLTERRTARAVAKPIVVVDPRTLFREYKFVSSEGRENANEEERRRLDIWIPAALA